MQGTHYMQTTVVNPCTCQQMNQSHLNTQRRGNQINWNNQFAQRNGVSLNNILKPKPCYICGRTNHLARQCYFNPINQRIHFQSKNQNSYGYRNKNRYFMANKNMRKSPIKYSHIKRHFHNKFAGYHDKSKIFFKNRIYKKTNNSDEIWVISSKEAAETVSAANNVNTVNNIGTANLVSTANSVSTAHSVSTVNSVSAVDTVNAAKNKNEPIISTKYSSHKIPSSVDPQSSKLSKVEYVDINGKPKTTEAWVPIRN